MKIGDEVYVHGYVDEIRNDVVIIRNDGGYFGTVEDEIICFTAKFHKEHIEPKVVIEPQKWEAPPKFEHKGVTTTCVSVPACMIEDKPQRDIEKIVWHKDRGWIEDEPQTDLLVKTPRKSRESHEKNCETCRDKDAYDEWEGNCDECENGSMYTPQTDCDHRCVQTEVGCERTDCAWK